MYNFGGNTKNSENEYDSAYQWGPHVALSASLKPGTISRYLKGIELKR